MMKTHIEANGAGFPGGPTRKQAFCGADDEVRLWGGINSTNCTVCYALALAADPVPFCARCQNHHEGGEGSPACVSLMGHVRPELS